MILTLQSSFSSAHFYRQSAWSDQKNREIFGACYTEHGHGHNYLLEVGFKTSARDLAQEKMAMQELLNTLTKTLDHEHLNHVIPEFKEQVPTTENIAQYFLDKISEEVPREKITSLRLFEMDNLWTEIQP